MRPPPDDTRGPIHPMQDTQPYRRPRQAQAQRVRRSIPKQRRPTNWRRRIGIFGLLLMAIAVTGVVLLAQRAIAFNNAVSTESALSIRLFGPFAESRVNVLLLGYSDESRDGAFLSDSVNVISVDRETDITTMIPIPRDLWVEGLSEVPQNMKINEAFRIGYYEGGIAYGAELATKAVTRVTGLPIHGWMSLDFQGFEAMVDALGGITVDNPTAFEYTWDEPDYLAANFQYAFAAGSLELDGQQALDYARNRYTNVVEESSDFARLVRQQRVLQAIRAEVTGWDTLPKGLRLADSLAGHLHTNLPVFDLAVLGGKLDAEHRIELRENEILQATTNTIGQYVLVVMGRSSSDDYSVLHDFLVSALEAIPTDAAVPTMTPQP